MEMDSQYKDLMEELGVAVESPPAVPVEKSPAARRPPATTRPAATTTPPLAQPLVALPGPVSTPPPPVVHALPPRPLVRGPGTNINPATGTTYRPGLGSTRGPPAHCSNAPVRSYVYPGGQVGRPDAMWRQPQQPPLAMPLVPGAQSLPPRPSRWSPRPRAPLCSAPCGSSIDTSLAVPPDLLPIAASNGCQLLRDISSETGALVSISDFLPGGARRIRIVGLPAAIEDAKICLHAWIDVQRGSFHPPAIPQVGLP